MGSNKYACIGAIDLRLIELVKPGATHLGRLTRGAGLVAPVLLEMTSTIAVSLKQALHQGGWQGSRGQQHARAQQPGPMHQAGQRWQIVYIEVVWLVKHQITAHQPQHGRNLTATAFAFSRWRQVVNGANQQGRNQQRAHLGVAHHAA